MGEVGNGCDFRQTVERLQKRFEGMDITTEDDLKTRYQMAFTENVKLRKEMESILSRVVKNRRVLEGDSFYDYLNKKPLLSEKPIKAEGLSVVEKVEVGPQQTEKGPSAGVAKGKNKPAVQRPVDVSRLDLRIGLVRQVDRHPDADKLFVSQIDVGEQECRTVCSGLVGHLPKEQLENRMVLLLCNLKPVKMRGVLSQAMVMCAVCEDSLEVIEVESNARIGEQVICPEFKGQPDKQLDGKGKIYQSIQVDLRTNGSGQVCYKQIPMRTEQTEAVLRAPNLPNAIIR